MQVIRIIIFQLMSFMAGGMFFVNLALLTPGAGTNYEATWYKVIIFAAIGFITAMAAHSDDY